MYQTRFLRHDELVASLSAATTHVGRTSTTYWARFLLYLRSWGAAALPEFMQRSDTVLSMQMAAALLRSEGDRQPVQPCVATVWCSVGVDGGKHQQNLPSRRCGVMQSLVLLTCVPCNRAGGGRQVRAEAHPWRACWLGSFPTDRMERDVGSSVA